MGLYVKKGVGNLQLFIKVLASASQYINDITKAFTDLISYETKFNGQSVYIERYLNDQYDPINRGIYIENFSDVIYNYFSNKAELEPDVYTYNYWDYYVGYAIGDRVIYLNKIYEAIDININVVPTDTAYWVEIGRCDIYFNRGEVFREYDFIVWVPIAVSYVLANFEASINKYKLADKRHLIQTY